MRKDRLQREEIAAGQPPPNAAAATGQAESCTECSIVQEADHRIANHLTLLAGFVRLKAADLARQSDASNNVEVLLLLESVRAQIEAISHLHRSLAADGSAASADLGEHLHDVCAPLARILSGRMDLIEDIAPGMETSAAQILPLTQIVAEVITNAIKHAGRAGRVGKIVVRCRPDETQAIAIEVIDDGPGLPAGFDPATGGGLGFRLIRALGKQLGARVAFEPANKGLCFRLTLPQAA